MPHSAKTRDAVLQGIQAGRSYRDLHAEYGVALGVMSRWAKAAGIEPANSEQVAAAAAATSRAWTQRRGELVDRFGEVAASMLAGAEAAEDAGDARNFMTAAAIAVDKAQLLSGGVTSRHEQLDAQRRRERVEGLADELAARRAAKDGTGS